MSLMLSSVRNAAEAAIALDGGSDWIDVKEPGRGALGAPDRARIVEVVARVAGRVPVSATIGDCRAAPERITARVGRLAGAGLDYVKLGLDTGDGLDAGLAAIRQCSAHSRWLIAVCMAERAPSPAALEAMAAAGVAGIMLDTFEKSGPGLTGLMTPAELRAFTARTRELGLLSGLAGRLAAGDVPALLGCGADYLGFRSALCAGGSRTAVMEPGAVAEVRAAMSVRAPAPEVQPSEVA